MSIFDKLFNNQPKPLPDFRMSANYTITHDDLQDQDQDNSAHDYILDQLSKILDDDTQCAIDLKADKIKNGERWTVTFRRANIFRRSDEIDNKNENIRIAFCDQIECKTLKNFHFTNNTDPTNLVEMTQISVDVYD